MPALTLAGGLAAVQAIDSAIDIILKYSKRLVGDKAGAAVRLSQALTTVRASCDTLDQVAAAYTALGYVNPAELATSETLHTIRGGRLEADVERGFGGCSLIREIYSRDLDGWFSRLFGSGSAEHQELESAFRRLGEADWTMFDEMRATAERLNESAGEVLDLVDAGQLEEARDRIRAQRRELEGLRRSINTVLKKIEQINGKLIGAGLR